MHTVAAVVDQGALTFDLSIPCEVFGLDRSDIASTRGTSFSWSRRGKRRCGPRPASCSTRRTGWTTSTAPTPSSCPAGRTPRSRLPTHCAVRCRPPTRAAHASSRSAPARSCWRTPACSTGVARPRTGATPTSCARRYPSVEVDPNPLYVSDDSIHTSAGTAAGIDLCLALVAADHGIEVAAAVSRRLVMPLHRPGGQAQYIDAPIEPPAAELLEWARGGSGTASGSTTWPRTRRCRRARSAATSPATSARRPASGWRASGCDSPSGCSSRPPTGGGRGAPRGLRVGGDAARAVRGPPGHVAARLPGHVQRDDEVLGVYV